MKHISCAGGSSVYGIGMLGGIWWAIRGYETFGSFLVDLLQAVFWPAVFVYKAFGLLG
ncbi:MAG TPA: hypothetical protein VD862_03710 [Candidatus Paceibacterota bacterium]|nr:hypothetical protein [Candidatus Paceibacterota bacterium]